MRLSSLLILQSENSIQVESFLCHTSEQRISLCFFVSAHWLSPRIGSTRPWNQSNPLRFVAFSEAATNNVSSNSKQKLANSMIDSSMVQQSYGSANSQQPDDFQTGDFIVSRNDVFLDWPAVWRVDSKTLLQKFEPFHSNGKTIYRSLSTVRINGKSISQLKC